MVTLDSAGLVIQSNVTCTWSLNFQQDNLMEGLEDCWDKAR
jgi:hypothetical protein